MRELSAFNLLTIENDQGLTPALSSVCRGDSWCSDTSVCDTAGPVTSVSTNKQSVSRVEVVNYQSDLDILQCDELAKMILLYSL